VDVFSRRAHCIAGRRPKTGGNDGREPDKALEKFRQGITLQGGDPRVIDDYGVLPAASHKLDVTAATSGYLAATNCMEFGIALAMLGRRARNERRQDRSRCGAGVSQADWRPRGKGRTLVTIHYNSAAKLDEAKARIASAFTFSENKTAKRQPSPRSISFRRFVFAESKRRGDSRFASSSFAADCNGS